MISETLLKEWKWQAEKDGNLDKYEYYLGMVCEPLPYQKWKMKKRALYDIQERHDYKTNITRELLEREIKLSNELGY